MVKTKLKEIKDEIAQQDADVYGDTSISGSMPDPDSDDDLDEALGEVMGADASEDAEQHDTETIAEEIDKDEKARHTKPELQAEDEE